MRQRMSAISRQLSAICILVFGPLVAFSGQTLAPLRKLSLNEPLEKYNMPPAIPRKIEISPGMVSPFGAFTSFQVNVDANGKTSWAMQRTNLPFLLIRRMAIRW
jgi:hypothetical protein